MYFNYKKYYSILLFALVDADYRLMFMDIGAEGSCNDAGIFNRSILMQALENNTANIPAPEPFPYDDTDMPYFIIGDDAFGLWIWLMKPFPHLLQLHDERIFNYRLSRARRAVKCAFGILASR